MSHPPDRRQQGWPPGLWTAGGLIAGAVLGSTIFENLALSTGIGVVVGALVDLRHRHREASGLPGSRIETTTGH